MTTQISNLILIISIACSLNLKLNPNIVNAMESCQLIENQMINVNNRISLDKNFVFEPERRLIEIFKQVTNVKTSYFKNYQKKVFSFSQPFNIHFYVLFSQNLDFNIPEIIVNLFTGGNTKKLLCLQAILEMKFKKRIETDVIVKHYNKDSADYLFIIGKPVQKKWEKIFQCTSPNTFFKILDKAEKCFKNNNLQEFKFPTEKQVRFKFKENPSKRF